MFGVNVYLLHGFDMEEQMRKNKVPLYALESGDSLADFDSLVFTLQYETQFTNILNMLDLAGIPLKSCDRPFPFPACSSRRPMCLQSGAAG